MSYFLLHLPFTTGGLMMEMVPSRVHRPIGSVVTFSCSYHSSEQMDIEFQESPPGSNNVNGLSSASDSQHSHALMRYSWGARRLLPVVVRPDSSAVECRVVNMEGQSVGMLASIIQPGVTPSIHFWRNILWSHSLR